MSLWHPVSTVDNQLISRKSANQLTCSTHTATAPAMPPKKKKDPNAPKRALSSFMFYSNAVRDTVRKAQPNIPFSEVAKVIGQQWRGLTTEDKKPYDDMATADKARYAQEKKNYTPDVRFVFADGLPGSRLATLCCVPMRSPRTSLLLQAAS